MEMTLKVYSKNLKQTGNYKTAKKNDIVDGI